MRVCCVWEPGTKLSAARGWLVARTRAAGAPAQGTRPLTPIIGWLACALPRIRISNKVDPSARPGKWAGECEGSEVCKGFQGSREGCYILLTPVCFHGKF